MEQKIYHVIGAMSGTSLDGVDLAYLKFEKEENWNYTILEAESICYPTYWNEKLSHADFCTEEELQALNTEYTGFLAKIISNFIQKHQIAKLDAVCSHGHTVFHQPEKGVSLQIGNLYSLAEILDRTVVCDFRKQDVALGGQGAPLVPIGDLLLFPEYDFCLNLGGFANISMDKMGIRTAYDICPVNTVLNFYAQKLGSAYDENGNIAASGKVDKNLLNRLNECSFYKKPAPKSLGIEWVRAKIFPLLKKSNLSETTILATFTEHASQQIAASIGNDENKQCLCTGGGVHNRFLMEKIRKKTKTQLVAPEIKLIEFKEALIFGLLGVLKIRNETNVLSSVTGAKSDHSSGVVWPKPK